MQARGFLPQQIDVEVEDQVEILEKHEAEQIERAFREAATHELTAYKARTVPRSRD